MSTIPTEIKFTLSTEVTHPVEITVPAASPDDIIHALLSQGPLSPCTSYNILAAHGESLSSKVALFVGANDGMRRH
jgi:hypothetical protein